MADSTFAVTITMKRVKVRVKSFVWFAVNFRKTVRVFTRAFVFKWPYVRGLTERYNPTVHSLEQKERSVLLFQSRGFPLVST